MTIDLACLLGLALWSLVLWSLVLNHTPAIGRMRKLGTAWGMSNREETPMVADWIGRADRAQRNHHDNFPMLAIVILMAHVTTTRERLTLGFQKSPEHRIQTGLLIHRRHQTQKTIN